METKIEFQASSGKGERYTAATPKEAAQGFFERFPNRRKCSIYEGETNGDFFSISFKAGKSPRTFKDITKKQIDTLPSE